MSRERNGLYEGMYILSATLSNESRKKALDKITDGISQKGGEIKKIHDQGRRKLCYEIKGKKEGHYYVIYFSAPTRSITDLWKDYHLHEDLLRFMTVKTDVVLENLEFNPIRIQG
ncbi:MAG TPA: 30S ribosomal protein S6 [Chlamydiales bacterium]|nr:30S ribosomal protein S6 [Chlamydiales bacterium]